MQNKYFFAKMQQFISELFWAFAGKPFEIYTTNVMEDKIRCEVEKLYPDFYLNARIVGREIRISREFYKEYAIAMMFSILIVMFGYLVFKIRTDQSQSTTASTRKRSKKRGTGKPVIKNNWNMRPLDTKDPADKDLRYEDFVESSWKEIEK